AEAALAPERADLRLVPLGNGAAQRLYRRSVRLAVIAALPVFVMVALPEVARDRAFEQTYGALYALGVAAAMLMLLSARLWKPGGPLVHVLPRLRAAATAVDWGTAIRIGMQGAVVLAVVLIVVGYGLFGSFILRNLLISGVLVAAMLMARILLREAVLSGMAWIEAERGQLMVSEMPTLPRWLVLAAIDAALAAAGLLLVLPLWGFDWSEVLDEIARLLIGFSIGSVRIAPIDVALAVIASGAVLVATRWAQRAADRRLMGNAAIDIGVRTAIRTGIGYVGIGLAIAATVGLIGFDLTNFALIAGALSVGIGFGMQNLFNNFASGLILLIERPIKVGDWVQVGDKEGWVRRIDVRSTEIETPERSAVIVPNSDILQTAVVNWTHKDRKGRINVRVAVAADAEMAAVERVLKSCVAGDGRFTADPAPQVLLVEIGEDTLEYELRAWLENVDTQEAATSDLRKAVIRALSEAGIPRKFGLSMPTLRAPAAAASQAATKADKALGPLRPP
ncbi:MAG: mechanosensitive ion channel, partial [Alphaproteobacteria bacterium]|nr:mechanosensitive ion channel [Alphaproteobacteria bacterium]